MTAEVHKLRGLERERFEMLRILSGLAEDDGLAKVLQDHRLHTENHLHHLTAVGKKWASDLDKACPRQPMRVRNELQKILQEASRFQSCDTKIAAAAQRIGRIKVERCEAVARLAGLLGDRESAEKLLQLAQEEQEIEARLRTVAKSEKIKKDPMVLSNRAALL